MTELTPKKYNQKLYYSILAMVLIAIVSFTFGFFNYYNKVDENGKKVHSILECIIRGFVVVFVVIAIILLIMGLLAVMFSLSFIEVFFYSKIIIEIFVVIFEFLAGNI